MSRLYPVYLDLAGRPVLVVGGGRVAARKARRLQECGADLTIVAPRIIDQLRELGECPNVTTCVRPYQSPDIEGVWLVVAATGDNALNRRISGEAEAAGAFCNVVDEPELCSFHVPAVMRRGLLQLAISTGGASPALARRLRKQLEKQFGPSYGHLMGALARLRREVKRTFPDDQTARRDALEGFLDSGIPEILLDDNDYESFDRELIEWISDLQG